MKKLSVSYKKILIKRSINGLRPKKKYDIAFIEFNDGRRIVRIGSNYSAVPAELCLKRNYDETAKFFFDMRMKTSRRMTAPLISPVSKKRGKFGWMKNYRDFTTIRFLSVGAALVLASEYDRIKRLSRRPPAPVNISKWRPGVRSVLCQLGFFNLLDIRYKEQIQNSSIIVEQMVASHDADISQGVAAIRSLFEKVGGSTSLRVALSSAVTDAIENVVNHAYPLTWSDRRHRVPLWWFVGAVDPLKRRFILIIYDHGITIPGSLPIEWGEHVVGRLLELNFKKIFDKDDYSLDGYTISAAMKVGNTSSGFENRGKGLPKILEHIRRCPEGRLRIISRCGECVYQVGAEDDIRTHSLPLQGTYIELAATMAPDGGS